MEKLFNFLRWVFSAEYREKQRTLDCLTSGRYYALGEVTHFSPRISEDEVISAIMASNAIDWIIEAISDLYKKEFITNAGMMRVFADLWKPTSDDKEDSLHYILCRMRDILSIKVIDEMAAWTEKNQQDGRDFCRCEYADQSCDLKEAFDKAACRYISTGSSYAQGFWAYAIVRKYGKTTQEKEALLASAVDVLWRVTDYDFVDMLPSLKSLHKAAYDVLLQKLKSDQSDVTLRAMCSPSSNSEFWSENIPYRWRKTFGALIYQLAASGDEDCLSEWVRRAIDKHLGDYQEFRLEVLKLSSEALAGFEPDFYKGFLTDTDFQKRMLGLHVAEFKSLSHDFLDKLGDAMAATGDFAMVGKYLCRIVVLDDYSSLYVKVAQACWKAYQMKMLDAEENEGA